MKRSSHNSLPALKPDLQISFYYRLQALQDLYLHNALKRTIEGMDIETLDDQLVQYVKPEYLKRIASFGLRGELFFAVPCIIEANPYLLGYYRLLLGISGKQFYDQGPFGRFKRFEVKGDLPDRLRSDISALCSSLVQTAQVLVDNIDDLTLSVIRDLQLLTLGAQLRGSRNTRIGQDAAQEVFELIHSIAEPYVKERTDRTIRIENDSHRLVLIVFSNDPDVRITEQLPSSTRPIVSIEIKGGKDASNIHNRLGEAEKSHVKASKRGFFEFWTIVRVDIDPSVAKAASPTTSRVFHLDRICDPETPEHKEFRETFCSLIGIQT
jgi:hypothetical protein